MLIRNISNHSLTSIIREPMVQVDEVRFLGGADKSNVLLLGSISTLQAVQALSAVMDVFREDFHRSISAITADFYSLEMLAFHHRNKRHHMLFTVAEIVLVFSKI